MVLTVNYHTEFHVKPACYKKLVNKVSCEHRTPKTAGNRAYTRTGPLSPKNGHFPSPATPPPLLVLVTVQGINAERQDSNVSQLQQTNHNSKNKHVYLPALSAAETSRKRLAGWLNKGSVSSLIDLLERTTAALCTSFSTSRTEKVHEKTA